jgi:hypothetical protein
MPQDSDMLVDLGTIPAVRADGPRLAQAIAHLLLIAAEASALGAGSITVRTFRDGKDVVVALTHPAPTGEEAAIFPHVAEVDVESQGGRIAQTQREGVVTVEIRLAT